MNTTQALSSPASKPQFKFGGHEMNTALKVKGVALALGLTACLLATDATVTSAAAQPRDRCHDYANELVSLSQRAKQLQCAEWKKYLSRNGSYDQHYSWCQKVSPSASQNSLNVHNSDFQRCQFQASGSPAAQPARPTPPPVRAAAKLPDGPGCPKPGSVRSQKTNQPATIQIVNSSFETLKIYWLNNSGQMVFQRELKHGQSYKQNTQMRNFWLAASANGGCFEPYEPEIAGANRMEIR
ncbi:MAG: hypothetical protein ACRCWF_13930 [Beijerinckiaceae bacterium]